MPSTIRLHRVLKTTPERLYKAFSQPDALVKWMAPHGFTAKVHSMDFRKGGSYKMSFANLTTGNSHSFGGELRITQEGVPDVIPADACYLGWGESLELLKLLVEPEIRDGA